MKKQLLFLLFIAFTLTFQSCSEDDYTEIDEVPIATDDSISSTLTSAVDIPVLANDTTGDVVIPTTVSIINGIDTDSNSTLDNLIVANQGTWSVNASTGVITFSPIDTFTGNPTPISYTVKDAQNNTSNTATITITAVAIVSADLSQVPYPKLSDYHFFIGDIKKLNPSLNVLPYEPASSLFTDYALKKRFIWMPSGVQATYNVDNKILLFPTGTVLIKNFYYTTIQPNNTTKIIETRLMIRQATGWVFVEYIWNDEQTDAFLVSGTDFTNGSSQTITFKKNNDEIVTIDYRIPSDAECIACHKINEIATPIGVKPQNLNFSYNYNGETKNQLQKLVDQGYLTSFPSSIVSTVNYKDTSKSLELRTRSYIDANCAHCHQDQGRCDYRSIRLGFAETIDPTNIGVCVIADETISPTLQKIVSPGNYSKSIMHYRMVINEESQRMPLLGRTIVHDEGIELIEQWIISLSPCN